MCSCILNTRLIVFNAKFIIFNAEFMIFLSGTNRDDASGAAFLFRNVGLLESLDMWSW